MDAEKNTFLVKDIHLASLLYSHGLKLLKLKQEKDFFWFVFEDKARAEDLTNKYWQKNIEVNARIYVDSLRILRDRLFAVKSRS
jgi:hypothetical protein